MNIIKSIHFFSFISLLFFLIPIASGQEQDDTLVIRVDNTLQNLLAKLKTNGEVSQQRLLDQQNLTTKIKEELTEQAAKLKALDRFYVKNGDSYEDIREQIFRHNDQTLENVRSDNGSTVNWIIALVGVVGFVIPVVINSKYQQRLYKIEENAKSDIENLLEQHKKSLAEMEAKLKEDLNSEVNKHMNKIEFRFNNFESKMTELDTKHSKLERLIRSDIVENSYNQVFKQAIQTENIDDQIKHYESIIRGIEVDISEQEIAKDELDIESDDKLETATKANIQSLKMQLAGAYQNLAIAYNHKGDNSYTQEYFEKSIEIDPANPHSFYNLGVYWFSLNEYDKSLLMYDKSLNLDPNYKDSYRNRAIVYYAKNDLESAIVDFAIYLEKVPDDHTIRAKLSECYYRAQRFSEAIEEASRILNKDSNFVPALEIRGASLGQLKKFEKAIIDLSQAIAINNNTAFSYHNRANCYLEINEFEKAKHDYDKHLELDPTSIDSILNRALAKIELKEYETAVEELDQLIKSDNNNAKAYMIRGLAKANQKIFDEAVHDYDNVIRINPSYPMIYISRGMANFAMGRFNELLSDAEKAIDNNEDIARASLLRGFYYLLNNNKSKVLENLDIILKANSKDFAILKGGDLLYTSLIENISDENEKIELSNRFKPIKDKLDTFEMKSFDTDN